MAQIVIPNEPNYWNKLLTLVKWIQTDKGLLTLIWILRLAALLGLTTYVVVNQKSYSESVLSHTKIVLLVFFAYVMATGIGGIYHPEWLLSRSVKLAQVIIEIGLYPNFYYLSQNPQSDVYFLYFLPLFMAARYLGKRWILVTLNLASISLYITLANMITPLGVYSIAQIYLSREVFMIGMTTLLYLYTFIRRSSTLIDMQNEQSQLIAAFKGFIDGVYVVDKEQRLLFVNDVLQAKHGLYTSGQTCASYFMPQGSSYQWCPSIESLTNPYLDTFTREGTFIDQDGHPYQVEVSVSPLPDENGQIVWVIAFVKDVSRQKQLEQQFKEQRQLLEKQIHTLNSERTKWLETYYQMGNRLAGFDNSEKLIRFVVSETKERLNAEASTLFLFENDRLVRKAIAGIEDDWFPDENYNIGEGLVGQVVLPKNGEKYGKPLLTNEADKKLFISPSHLAKYKERLKTHEVKHFVAVPLNGQERSFGVLRVINKLDSKDSLSSKGFHEKDKDFLVSIASMVAIAIENARLLQNEQEKRRIADTLREVSKVVNSSLDLQRVLQYIMKELGKVVAYDSTSIQLVYGNQLKIIACAGFNGSDKIIGLTFPIDDPKFPNYQVVTRKVPYIVQDVCLQYPHFVEEAEKYHSQEIRSWMGIPLIYRDHPIGMISLEKGIPNNFTQDKAYLALTFANQVTVAIENARLFQETQQQVEQLDKLHQVSQVITSSLDVAEVLRKIVFLTGEVTNSDHTGVVLVEEGILVTSVEDHPVGIPLHERARPNGITRQVIATAKPIIFDEVQDNNITHNPVIIKEGFNSYAGVPIVTRGRQVRGVLFVHSFKFGAFKLREALLQTFCNQAAIAIENAESFRTAADQAVMFTKLVEIGSELIKHVSLEELYRFCVDSGMTIFDVEDCSLYVKSEETQTIDLVASSSIPPSVWTRNAPIAGPGLPAYVTNTGDVLNFRGDEYKEHPAWGGRYEEPFLDHLEYLPSKKCHSLLIGPLIDSKDNCVGVLKLENKCGTGAGKQFSPFEKAMFETFAYQIGIAIERARLYEQLDEKAERNARDSLSHDLHDIMNVLHGTLVLGTAYLAELMDMREYNAANDALDKIKRAARHVHTSLWHLHKDVRDPILQDKGLDLASKHYTNLLAIPPVRFEIIRKRLPLDIEYALYKIIQESLNNIVKHAKLGPDGDVHVKLSKTSYSFQLIISDNGVGFDVETTLNRSDAFGLQSIRRWVESIGAELKISSQLNFGTRIYVKGGLKNTRGSDEKED